MGVLSPCGRVVSCLGERWIRHFDVETFAIAWHLPPIDG